LSFLLTLRFEGFRGRSVGAEFDCLPPRVFELRAHVGRNEVAGLDSLEAMPLQNLCVLCFQQSPGNSAGPEINVSATFFADRILDGHVGDLHPPAGAEHAEDFRKHGILVRHEIDHAVGDHDVDTLVPEW
jgi:hypothetical protein